MSFVYIWEYRVRPESVATFEAVYGAEGDWVRLFRSHAGYLGTELLRDAADPTSYRTIDRWRSRADRDRCRERAAAEFEAIDRACEALTVEELHLGDFETVGHEGPLHAVPPAGAGADPVAARLRERVEDALPRLRAVTDERADRRPGGSVWSPKQVLGHLIDSASNNHQRFVRAQLSDDLVFAGYEQDGWVEAQGYAEAPWGELVELWALYNRQLARVMERIPAGVRNRPRARHNLDRVAFRSFDAGVPATLDAFMADYVDHLEHHLLQCFERLETSDDARGRT